MLGFIHLPLNSLHEFSPLPPLQVLCQCTRQALVLLRSDSHGASRSADQDWPHSNRTLRSLKRESPYNLVVWLRQLPLSQGCRTAI